MAILSFTLAPEAVGKFHDSIGCLGKFSEAVSIEATRQHVVLTALNSTKSAYASFTFNRSAFFSKYFYNPPRTNGVPQEKFTCKMYNKALYSVFKGRVVDPLHERDTSIEKCEVVIEDGAGEAKSRFIIKMVCKHGILKTYSLTFESVAPMHAIFDEQMARNRWSISSRTLQANVEHFGPGTEQLDMYSEDGRISFTSFTEKVMVGNEILKQPLRTSIAIDTSAFSESLIEEKLHIVISVRDFKAIVSHAGPLNTLISAVYSQPTRPMRLRYGDEGLTSEFILMTIGEQRGSSATTSMAGSRAGSKKPTPRQALEASSSSRLRADNSMPPPPRSVAPMVRESGRSRIGRPSPPPPQPSVEANALFFTEADDDRKWDPANDTEEEDEEVLGWDVSGDQGSSSKQAGQRLQQDVQSQSINGSARQHVEEAQRIAPTQKISEIRGLLDE